jgi:APA family basic amino acid/polyamine antiporter
MATAIVVGTVIGSGIFKKPASIASDVSHFGLVALVWIVGGLLTLLGALAYAEVAVLLPHAGGNYVYLRDSFGRLSAFLWGWADFVVIRTASLAALGTIFSESFSDVLSAFGPRLSFWQQQVLTIGLLLGLALINVRGTTWGGGLQLFITLVKVGLLLFIAALPFAALWYAPSAETLARPDIHRLSPVWPEDWTSVSLGGLATAFLAVLWAYNGWMNVAPVAEEVKNPQRNLPLSLLAGVGLIVLLYLAANLAYALVIPHGEMAALKNKDTTVVAEFSRRLLGPTGAAFASAAVMCSVFGALNGNLIVGPRALFAMGRDGLAIGLQAVHPRFHTPARAIWVLAGWATIQVLVVGLLTSSGLLSDKSSFDTLTDFSMFGAIIFETLAVLAIFVLRRKWPDVPRPYRCLGYPIVPALYVVLPGCILCNYFFNQRLEALVGTAFILLGGLVYYVFGLSRTGPVVAQGPKDVDGPRGQLVGDGVLKMGDGIQT